jgi:hypothetical protein
VPVAAVGPERKDVHGDEDGQQDTGGLDRRDHQRHERHGEQTERAGEAALRKAEDDDRRDGREIERRLGDHGGRLLIEVMAGGGHAAMSACFGGESPRSINLRSIGFD